MKRLLSWLIVSPILLFLIWLTGISSAKFRDAFMTATYILSKGME